MTYFDELAKAMTLLSANPKTIFMGQAVTGGTTMSSTFDGVPKDRLLEFPVAEDLQLGCATGMSLEGWLPICVYPRMDFLLLASNQLVLHLDRLPLYSDGGYNPKVIIRTAVPTTEPINAGPQHDDDFTGAFILMLRTVRVVRLIKPEDVVPAYMAAASPEVRRSTLIIEDVARYKDEMQ